MSYYVLFYDETIGWCSLEYTSLNDAMAKGEELSKKYTPVKVIEGRTKIAWHESDTKMQH